MYFICSFPVRVFGLGVGCSGLCEFHEVMNVDAVMIFGLEWMREVMIDDAVMVRWCLLSVLNYGFYE